MAGVLRSEIWEIEDQHPAADNVKVMALLKLSYDHLPAYLKHCFEYYSLFPKYFFFFYSNERKKKKKKKKKKRGLQLKSFLLLILNKERMKEWVGMLMTIKFETAHLVIWCVQKLIDLEILNAVQFNKEWSC
jgi:hypothetical protein